MSMNFTPYKLNSLSLKWEARRPLYSEMKKEGISLISSSYSGDPKKPENVLRANFKTWSARNQNIWLVTNRLADVVMNYYEMRRVVQTLNVTRFVEGANLNKLSVYASVVVGTDIEVDMFGSTQTLNDCILINANITVCEGCKEVFKIDEVWVRYGNWHFTEIGVYKDNYPIGSTFDGMQPKKSTQGFFSHSLTADEMWMQQIKDSEIDFTKWAPLGDKQLIAQQMTDNPHYPVVQSYYQFRRPYQVFECHQAKNGVGMDLSRFFTDLDGSCGKSVRLEDAEDPLDLDFFGVDVYPDDGSTSMSVFYTFCIYHKPEFVRVYDSKDNNWLDEKRSPLKLMKEGT